MALALPIFQRDGTDVAGCLHNRAIKRPTTQNRPEPAISPVVDLRYDSHLGAFRATTSGLAKEDVLGEHCEAHLVQVISRCLCVSGRLPSGRLHVAKNKRQKPGWRAQPRAAAVGLIIAFRVADLEFRHRQRQWASLGVWWIWRFEFPSSFFSQVVGKISRARAIKKRRAFAYKTQFFFLWMALNRRAGCEKSEVPQKKLPR